MEPGTWIDVLLVLGFVLMGGVFAATELALVSLRPAQVDKLEAQGGRGHAVASLARDPNRFLSAVQIGVTVAGFFSAAFGASTLAPSFAPAFESLGTPGARDGLARRRHPRRVLPLARPRRARAQAARAPALGRRRQALRAAAGRLRAGDDARSSGCCRSRPTRSCGCSAATPTRPVTRSTRRSSG